MKYGEIQVGKITSSQEHEEATILLCEEFPDHAHHKTRLEFYDYALIAKKSNEVIGLITGNKYLPHKVMLCDIVIAPEHRSKAVGMKLIKAFCQAARDDGFMYGTGITSKKNREALNTYKKLGGHQEEMIVTTSILNETIAICDRKEQILKHRENNIKRR